NVNEGKINQGEASEINTTLDPNFVEMVPEEAGDLWMAYNLIVEGDIVLAIQS
ncbi:Hypothetical predicted protein, partial [Olea europaea subsp. europaea]